MMSDRFKKTAAGFVLVLAAAYLSAYSAGAEDFSKNSKIKPWGLSGEVKAAFSGKVVDVLCELSGDCPDQCGAGKRQMGILRDADQKLILVFKNNQRAFNGPVEDLLPFCGKTVDVDGAMIGEDEKTAKVFLVHVIREKGQKEWVKAQGWIKAWEKRNPGAKGKGPWFKRDPRVKKQISKTGYLGLGLEADEKWREEEAE